MTHDGEQPTPAKKKNSGVRTRGSVPLEDPVHEKFCTLVQSGVRPTAAALRCGLSKSSGNYFMNRPDISRRIKWLQKDAERRVQEVVVANQSSVQAKVLQRPVDIGRNQIVNLLAEIARNPEVAASSRVSALVVLVDIFMLRARNLKELNEFYGWTDDDLTEFIRTGETPERLRAYFPDGKGPGESLSGNPRGTGAD